MKMIHLITLFFIGFLISGCSIQQDPRAMASNKMFLTYDGEQCQPYESFVPYGEDIDITIRNTSEFDITWFLIFHGIDGEFEKQDPDNILASVKAPASQTTISTIKSPYLPGRYDSFCVRDDDTNQRALTFFVVVHPYED